MNEDHSRDAKIWNHCLFAAGAVPDRDISADAAVQTHIVKNFQNV